MKKFFCFSVSAVMAMIMAGCSSSDSSGESEAAASSSVTETVTSAVTLQTSADTETALPVTGTAASEASESAKPEELPSDVTWLEKKPKQVINETPATYESLGADPAKKKEFISRHTKANGLPVINITTENGGYILSREDYVSCVVDLFNCDKKYRLSNVSAGIKVRGNSSAYYGKEGDIKKNPVPYRIKFDEKTNLLGLNNGAKCKSWVLLKSDWDLIRNDIALRFGRAIIGDDTFCSDGQLCIVYVNDKYQDIYLLCEQCQADPERVDINEPDEFSTDLETGYYLEIDNYAYDEPYAAFFTLDHGNYTVKDVLGEERAFVPAEYSVKSRINTREQMDFISKYMKDLFDIVYYACEKNEYKTFDENYELIPAKFTSAQETVGAVMDLESVVDLYLLYETVHDYDCGEGSFFMCIDLSEDSRHPKLEFTSPWDFNWAYNDSPERFWAAAFTEEGFVEKYGDRTNPWFVLLGKQEWFRKLASEKWKALNDAGKIRDVTAQEKKLLEKYKDDLNSTNDYAVGCAYDLLKWIESRLDWMDKTFGS